MRRQYGEDNGTHHFAIVWESIRYAKRPATESPALLDSPFNSILALFTRFDKLCLLSRCLRVTSVVARSEGTGQIPMMQEPGKICRKVPPPGLL